MGIKKRLIFLPFIIYFLGVAGYTYFRYEVEKEERLKEIDHRLRIGANQIACILPDGFPDRCTSTTSISREEHFKNMLRLNAAVKSTNFEYFYTIHKIGDEMYYTSTSYKDDEDPDSKDLAYCYSLKASGESHYEEIKELFDKKEPIFINNTDQWGNHRSCLMPHKSPNGKIYLTGADYETSYIEAELIKEVYLSITTAFLFLLMATPFMYGVHRYWRVSSNELKELNKKLNDDVRYRKRVERDLLKAKSEAEVAVETQKNFLANISHEIRTPMNGIVGMSTLLDDANLTEQQMDSLEIIQRCSRHLLKIMEDLLNFSKIDALGVDLKLKEVDVAGITKHTFSLLDELSKGKGIELKLSVLSNNTVINTDEVRLTQVILNLVNNAVKFSDSSNVTVELSDFSQKDVKGLQVKVIDKGVGIDANNISEIFEPFKQVDESTTRKFMGTGLGLAITEKLCAKLGGGIKVDSEVGKGSIFSFTVYDNKSE